MNHELHHGLLSMSLIINLLSKPIEYLKKQMYKIRVKITNAASPSIAYANGPTLKSSASVVITASRSCIDAPCTATLSHTTKQQPINQYNHNHKTNNSITNLHCESIERESHYAENGVCRPRTRRRRCCDSPAADRKAACGVERWQRRQ